MSDIEREKKGEMREDRLRERERERSRDHREGHISNS